MGARAQKRVVESGLSAEDLSRMLQEVDRSEYDAALERFTERKTQAEAAEVKAGERGRGQAAREAALDLREQQLDEKIAALGEREAAFEAWRQKYEAWLDDREVA